MVLALMAEAQGASQSKLQERLAGTLSPLGNKVFFTEVLHAARKGGFGFIRERARTHGNVDRYAALVAERIAYAAQSGKAITLDLREVGISLLGLEGVVFKPGLASRAMNPLVGAAVRSHGLTLRTPLYAGEIGGVEFGRLVTAIEDEGGNKVDAPLLTASLLEAGVHFFIVQPG